MKSETTTTADSPNHQPLAAAALPDALLTAKTVKAVTGLSIATLYRKEAAGELMPVRMGKRCTRWRACDVRAFMATAGSRTLTLTSRQTRLLKSLLDGPLSREHADRHTGTSNSPDIVFRLRKDYGLAIPCQRAEASDRDGKRVEIGIYSLTEVDRAKVVKLLGLPAAF